MRMRDGVAVPAERGRAHPPALGKINALVAELCGRITPRDLADRNFGDEICRARQNARYNMLCWLGAWHRSLAIRTPTDGQAEIEFKFERVCIFEGAVGRSRLVEFAAALGLGGQPVHSLVCVWATLRLLHALFPEPANLIWRPHGVRLREATRQHSVWCASEPDFEWAYEHWTPPPLTEEAQRLLKEQST